MYLCKLVLIIILPFIFLTGCSPKYVTGTPPEIVNGWGDYPKGKFGNGPLYVEDIKFYGDTWNKRDASLWFDIEQWQMKPEVFGTYTYETYRMCGGRTCLAWMSGLIVTLPLAPICYLDCGDINRRKMYDNTPFPPEFTWSKGAELRHTKKSHKTDYKGNITIQATSKNSNQTVYFRTPSNHRVDIRGLLKKFDSRPSIVEISVKDAEGYRNSLTLSSNNIDELKINNVKWDLKRFSKTQLVDMYKIRLQKNLQSNDFNEMIETLDALTELDEYSESFEYFYGFALFKSDQKQKAKVRLTSYINRAGREGKFYSQALALLAEY